MAAAMVEMLIACARAASTASGGIPTIDRLERRRRSDVVNLGYVVNVIENVCERDEALRSAWDLAGQVLVVAARLKADLGDSEPGEPFADGRLTRLQTFQKFLRPARIAQLDRRGAPDALRSRRRRVCSMCSAARPGAKPM